MRTHLQKLDEVWTRLVMRSNIQQTIREALELQRASEANRARPAG
jgi:hypothetical protein